jgi:hypothetical protein
MPADRSPQTRRQPPFRTRPPNGESTVRAVLESHFISRAAVDILLRRPFGAEDFEAFVSELRELDADVEDVELSLRKMISTTLGDQPSLLPSELLQRAEERIAQATRKNASLDGDQFRALSRKLEYLDLRELQNVITNKTLWGTFQSRFPTKESLATKFDQLAELRNGIRHSRTVDEVSRKEGEAAVLWFNQVLSKNLKAVGT